MTDAETAQILADADELEFTFGANYPAGSRGRMAFSYFAEILRREFAMTDGQKIELVLKTLVHCQPSTKESLIERLDFTREECRRVVELAIQSGMIEVTQEATNGRPRALLRIP